MTALPTPNVSRDRSLPLIWVVPIIAAVIGVWMGLRELRNRGPEITIDFSNGSGIEAGKTTLEYKGISAGSVQSVELRPDMHGVIVKLRLKRHAASLASAGSKFWIVHPEIGLSGVHGLDTLVSGVRLNVLPGSGPAEKHFIGLDETPAPEVTDEGRSFILQADKLGSLTTGAPVFYRELKVGSVEASRLSDASTSVLVRIHVEEPYKELVRTSTHFWNTGGFSFKVSLFGAQLKDTSLESLVSGGISFATPDAEPLAPPAEPGAHFVLASDPDKVWATWAPKIAIQAPESFVHKPDSSRLLPALMK
jgi:paraquat-inducible protein B